MFLGAFSIQDLSSTLSKPFSFFLSLSHFPQWVLLEHFSVSHFSLLVFPPFGMLHLLAPHIHFNFPQMFLYINIKEELVVFKKQERERGGKKLYQNYA